MISAQVENEYFHWLIHFVCKGRFAKEVSYKKLLSYLHDTEFVCYLIQDKNRADDGVELRRRFAMDSGFDENYFIEYMIRPCSVLEMMIALAIRCEETIMDDPRVGDRTGQWFWGMITNLGLGSITDDRFDEQYVDSVIIRFMERNYEPNGKGGLFTIRNCDCDLRRVDIWKQLCWYLDSIV